MNNLIEFRLINEIEKKIIRTTLIEILFEPDIVNNLYIHYIPGKNPNIFYIFDANISELKNFTKYELMRSVGLYFGYFKKGKFFLSLEAAEFLNNANQVRKEKLLILNEKGEKSVLYGNDIQKKMVLDLPNRIKKGELILILNRNNELLALAISKVDFNEFASLNQIKIIAKTLIDKGSYLRRKQ